jgi:hypothetical protein
MKLFINYIYIGLLVSSLLFSQENSNAAVASDERAISPVIQIRYDNFANENFTPSSAIGIKLRIDEDRFTGFDVNTDSKETRIIMGWKWSILGLSVKEVTLEDDSVENVNMYSFGVRYTLLNNVNTVIEYVLSGDSNTDDFLRLSIGVEF